jgi:hypothetical protein
LVPDFPGVGNADWGLSSLNEDTILFIETENSRKDKEKVAMAVANVLAHYVSLIFIYLHIIFFLLI